MNSTLESYSTKTKTTPQSEAIPGAGQVANSAGGYSFAVDCWSRLHRFLVLGSEGGSFYVKERKLTLDNVAALEECLKADGLRVVRELVAVSEAGRAPKNDYAIFALAYVLAHGDAAAKRAASQALPRVCRIGTHLLQFAAFSDNLRGWGRGLRRAVSLWYEGQAAERLAFQMVKYRSRHGFSQRDLLRLAHPGAGVDGDAELRARLYDWACGRGVDWHELPEIVVGYELAQRAASPEEAAEVARRYRLTHEMLLSEHLAAPEVWEALLPQMPLGALVRNLGRMSANGLLVPGAAATRAVVDKLADAEAITKARLHPLAVLGALKTYAQGHGERGKLTWTPVGDLVDALDGAFYSSFGNVSASGQRLMLAIDISGSMEWDTINGLPGLTPRVAAGALALVSAATERDCLISVFSSKGYGIRSRNNDGVEVVSLSPRQRLDDVLAKLSSYPAGGTDCALPMLYAAKHKLEVDAFVIYTDAESWANPEIHASQALERYRQQSGIDAKMICCAMVANEYSVADPRDPSQLDVVGFDTATPQLITDFSAGIL